MKLRKCPRKKWNISKVVWNLKTNRCNNSPGSFDFNIDLCLYLPIWIRVLRYRPYVWNECVARSYLQMNCTLNCVLCYLSIPRACQCIYIYRCVSYVYIYCSQQCCTVTIETFSQFTMIGCYTSDQSHTQPNRQACVRTNWRIYVDMAWWWKWAKLWCEIYFIR